MDTTPRLTREQDGVLRRLTFFELHGLRLSPVSRGIRAALRARDRRRSVREPWEPAVTTTR